MKRNPGPDRTGTAQLPPVQVFGQPELVSHLAEGGPHHTHLVSIGNPRSWFGINRADTRMPGVFRRHFSGILRLSFYDALQRSHLNTRQFPKRIPRKRDVRRAIRFYRRNRRDASGFVIHCWQGISRSTAVALGYLYLETGSEETAKRMLREIRPVAGPHPGIVGFFDDILGCNLTRVSDQIRAERLEEWKRELDLNADDLLEELAEATE